MRYVYYIFKLFFCRHIWVHVREVSVYDDPKEYPIYIKSVHVCKRCGKRTWFKI